jgi:hypothetical protein
MQTYVSSVSNEKKNSKKFKTGSQMLYHKVSQG